MADYGSLFLGQPIGLGLLVGFQLPDNPFGFSIHHPQQIDRTVRMVIQKAFVLIPDAGFGTAIIFGLSSDKDCRQRLLL